MNKKKLSFIIGTSALVANLGFSSMLIANAQSAPGILESCPSAHYMSVPAMVNFYTSETMGPPFTNPVSATAFTGEVYTSFDLGVAICSPASTVSVYIAGSNFVSQDQLNSIPLTDLELIDPQPFTCKINNNCTNESIPVNFIDGQNFPDNTPVGRSGSEDQILILGYNPLTAYPTGERPSGFYQTTINMRLTLNAKPPSRYTNTFTITLLE